jgi:hypothetical protein
MLGTFMVLVGLVIGPLWLMESQWLTVTLRNFGGRGAWQTIWALADGFYGYGQVHGNRFDPSPDFTSEPSIVPWFLVHALFAVGGLWLWTGPWKWQQAKVQVAFVALTIFLFHLWSKGWSPQFTLLLLPWILMLLPDGRGIGLALLFTSLMAWETIYYGFVVHRFEAPWMLVTIILLRTIALIVLTGIAVRRLRLWSQESGVEQGLRERRA